MSYNLGAKRLALFIAAGLLPGSCMTEGPDSADLVTVDTLANGAVHVVSRPEGAWALEGVEPWRVVEDVRIGVLEGEAPYRFGSARDVIPDALGRIWVLDSQAFELRLFDRDGGFVRTVGREGDGPGEFGFNPCAFPGPEGEIWVESGRRWQRFDTAGSLLGSQPTTSRVGCAIRRWLSSGRFLAATSELDPETRESRSLYLDHRRAESGSVTPVDTFPSPPQPEAPTVSWVNAAGRRLVTLYVPFAHSPMRALGPHGHVWITDGGGEYRIRRQSLTGDTLLVVERPYEPVPIPDSIRARELDDLDRFEGLTLETGFDLDDVPRVFPPFDRFTVASDGTLWVRRQLEGGMYGVDVFALDGRFLGPVDVPPDFGRMTIHEITPDYMYGTARDDLDVQYVVRLAIVKPGG